MLAFMAWAWLSGVLDFARWFGSIGVIALSILCGTGALLGIVLSIVQLLSKRPVVIEVDANELRVSRAGARKPSWVWPRQKVRGIVIQPTPIGLSLLAVRVGFDPPVALRHPYDTEKLQKAAEALHEALGIAQPPQKASLLGGALGE
jgi:hypothetical protein